MLGIGMELDLISGAALAVGGLVAGFVNTIAGGGSAISIPILIEILGDSLTANGTNRVAILLQNVVGLVGFHRGNAVPWQVALPLVVPVVAGGAAGSWVATRIDAETMRAVFAVVIVGVALSVLISPSRWKGGADPKLGPIPRAVVFIGIGFYGGLVQAGVGFLMLAGLVVGGGLTLVTGNAAKVLLVLAFTAVALPVFVLAGQVAPLAGVVLASGGMAGAWIASRLAVARGAGWIRWVLIVAALLAAARMLVLR